MIRDYDQIMTEWQIRQGQSVRVSMWTRKYGGVKAYFFDQNKYYICDIQAPGCHRGFMNSFMNWSVDAIDHLWVVPALWSRENFWISEI